MTKFQNTKLSNTANMQCEVHMHTWVHNNNSLVPRPHHTHEERFWGHCRLFLGLAHHHVIECAPIQIYANNHMIAELAEPRISTNAPRSIPPFGGGVWPGDESTTTMPVILTSLESGKSWTIQVLSFYNRISYSSLMLYHDSVSSNPIINRLFCGKAQLSPTIP